MAINTTMGQVSFNSKIPMVDGLVNIDGNFMPMDFIEYLPLNVDFEYYCNYGTYVESGTFKLTKSETELNFPMNKLEYNDSLKMVTLTINVDDPDAIISVYPLQLIDIVNGNLSLLPKIEVVDGKAMVPEVGIWIVMVDVKNKATTTKRFETNGNDVEVDVPTGGDIEDDDNKGKCHLQVNVSPITAKVEVEINGVWETRLNNYFENIDEGIYNVRVSSIGYISYKKSVNVVIGSNKVNIILVKENSDGSEIITIPNGDLPPVLYNELYINNISDFKFIRIIPLTNPNFEYINGHGGVFHNMNMWENNDEHAQYDPDLVDVDLDTGLIRFKGRYDAIGVWAIEAIPYNYTQYYKSTIYIDLYTMDYKYINIDLIPRERSYNLKCRLSNPEDCDKFHSYSISYETADKKLNSGVLSTAKIDEEINVIIPDGTYTIIATLHDYDGMEVRVPITPENFTPNKDLDISFKYNKHIKVTFKIDETHLYFGYFSLSVDNAPNLLTSSIFDEYGYDQNMNIRNGTILPKFEMHNSTEYTAYIQPNGGNLKLLLTIAYTTSDTICSSKYINLSNIKDGSVIQLDIDQDQNKDLDTISSSAIISNVLEFTPTKFKNGITEYYTNISHSYDKGNSPFIDGDSITESNIHSHIINILYTDAKYNLSRTFCTNNKYLDSNIHVYSDKILHNTVDPIFTNKTVNLTINTNIPDAEIIIYDMNIGLYKSISEANSYYGFPSIYRGKGSFNGDILDNCVYSATIYRSGFAIETFTFSAIGDDIIIDKVITPLNEWDNSISNITENITDTTDIEFDITEGSDITITSIQPHYSTISIDGNIIHGVPVNKKYKIRAIYNPPKNKVIDNPVSLTFGDIDYNGIHAVKDKKTIITINKNTGIDPIKCMVDVDHSNSPNLINKKIIIYHNNKKESINLNELPKTVNIFGYSEDMYLELYDNDILISKNMFLISHEYSDITIKVPNKQIIPITIKPFTKIKNRTFIAWEENDPYIAPYYGDNDLNKYTKYNKIEYGNNTVRYLYGSVGDVIKYMVYVDGFYPYEGSVKISNDTVIDLDTIIMPRSGVAFRYYGTISPNSEYTKYRCNYKIGNNLENKIMDGPIITWVESRGCITADVKYKIPMLEKNGDRFDIYEYKYDFANTTKMVTNNGYVKMYQDSRPSASTYSGLYEGGMDVVGGKYPLVITNGGLLSAITTIYNSLFKQPGGYYVSGQDRASDSSTQAYLYPGRYKYFTCSNYSGYIGSTISLPDLNNTDIIVYSAGDTVVKEGINYIESSHIANNIRDKNDHQKILVSSLSDTHQVQRNFDENPNYFDLWVTLAYKKYMDAVKIIGTDVGYRKNNTVYIPKFNDSGDTVIFADVTDFVEGDKDFETEFINISTKSDKNKDITFGSNLNSIDNNTIIKNVKFDDAFYLRKYRDDINYSTLSSRSYGFLINGNSPGLPIYYKIPHGDIVNILYNTSGEEYLLNGIEYELANIYIESPISYGMSYSKDSLNKTIVTIIETNKTYDAALISGDFPMKVKLKIFGIGSASGYSFSSPDIIMDGYINIDKNNVSLNEDGTYEYILENDNIVITNTEVLSSKYDSYVFDIDGRAFSGEFDMEILERTDSNDYVYDDMWYGHNDKFAKVNFDQIYNLREDNNDNTSIGPKRFYVRYIDKITRRSYILNGANYITTLTSDWAKYSDGINGNETATRLIGSLYNNDNVSLGCLKASNVSFKNDTSDIESVYLATKNLPKNKVNYDIIEIKNFNTPFKVLYGICQFIIKYKNNKPTYTFIKYINSDETLIDLYESIKIPYNDIKTGGYRFLTTIGFNEHWIIKVSNNEYNFTNKRSTSIPIGKYKYMAICNGHKSIYGELTITENEIIDIDIEFEKEDIIEFGTVKFRITPSYAKVYMKNEDGNYVKIRSDKMSTYLQYGKYEYIIKSEYYQDYTGTVDINDSYVTVNVQMTSIPTPKHLITFNLINPRHGVTTKVSVNNGEWFEAKEITAKQDDIISWLAEADGFERDGGTFGVYKDTTIDIDLSRGNGTLYIDNIPPYMQFYLEVTNKDGTKYWRPPFMDYIYIDIPRDIYNYKIVYDDDNTLKTRQEKFGQLEHLSNITDFDASCDEVYGTLNISVNISDYELELIEDVYPFAKRPVSVGSTRLPANKYQIICSPNGRYSNKYHAKHECFYINEDEIKQIDFTFGTDDLWTWALSLNIYPGSAKDYKIEVYSSGSWTTIDNNIIEGKPEGETTRVKVSRQGYISQDFTVTHGPDNRVKEINMIEVMEGGYLYPLYPSSIHSISILDMTRNKEIYEKYKHLSYNGTNFGKLPVTGTSPLILNINYTTPIPVAIDADRRESFILMNQPNSVVTPISRFYINADCSTLVLPEWADDTDVYTVKFEFFNHTFLGKKCIKENEFSYNITRSNSGRNNIIRIGSIPVPSPGSIRVTCKKSNGDVTFSGETIPSKPYTNKFNPIKIYPTFKQNGYYRIVFRGYSALVSGVSKLYIYLENSGNIISKDLGFVEEGKWVDVENITKLEYLPMVKMRDDKLVLKYIYREEGYKYMMGEIDITDKIQSYPPDNNNIVINDSMIRNELLKYGREKINDPVKVTFERGSYGVSRHLDYTIYSIGLPPYNDIKNVSIYATGATLEFERGTGIGVETSGSLNMVQAFILSMDHTFINEKTIANDKITVTAKENPAPIAGDKYNSIRVKFNIAKYNPYNPSIPMQNLKLNEFDEVIVMAIAGDDSHYIYRLYNMNTDTIKIPQTPIIHVYSITFRKKGYNTIYLPMPVICQGLNEYSTPKEISLPVLHPVTE